MEKINNEQLLTNKNKKKSNILVVILAVLIVILLLCLAIFGLYKATVDISNNNIDKFDYDFTQNYPINEYNIKDFVRYNSEEKIDTLFINIPKQIFYEKIIKIEAIRQDLIDKYSFIINKIGCLSNVSKQNIIDFYIDGTYNDSLDMYITGSIKYEFTSDNCIEVYMDKLVIGDGLPMFIYKAFLPINDGDLIFKINSNDYEFLKHSILSLDSINNIKLNNNALKFEFNYTNSIKQITSYILGDASSFVEKSIETMMPIILEITVGENPEQYLDIYKLISPYIKLN